MIRQFHVGEQPTCDWDFRLIPSWAIRLWDHVGDIRLKEVGAASIVASVFLLNF